MLQSVTVEAKVGKEEVVFPPPDTAPCWLQLLKTTNVEPIIRVIIKNRCKLFDILFPIGPVYPNYNAFTLKQVLHFYHKFSFNFDALQQDAPCKKPRVMEFHGQIHRKFWQGFRRLIK